SATVPSVCSSPPPWQNSPRQIPASSLGRCSMTPDTAVDVSGFAAVLVVEQPAASAISAVEANAATISRCFIPKPPGPSDGLTLLLRCGAPRHRFSGTLAPGMGQIPRTSGGQPGRTAEQGYLHCGPSGAGHFVKIVHNGIEYGLMQAYAEGFDILRNAGSADLDAGPGYDLGGRDMAEGWRRGSVVSSWLLDLPAQALAESPALSNYTGIVQDSGEGRVTVIAGVGGGGAVGEGV